MKEILKSKVLLLFVVMMLGVTYISASNTSKLEENQKMSEENLITLNIK